MEITRRDAVASFGLFAELIASGRYAEAEQQTSQQGPAAAARPPVFKHDLPNLSMNDWEVTVSYVDYPPGRVGAVHHHAGFVLAYVLEGAIIAKISGQGEEKTFRAGEMFYEQPGATHEVSKNASQTQPAKLLAMIFAKKGSTLTNPGPAQGPSGL
jgi:quercetin dioxygenase-like cupin family protein